MYQGKLPTSLLLGPLLQNNIVMIMLTVICDKVYADCDRVSMYRGKKKRKKTKVIPHFFPITNRVYLLYIALRYLLHFIRYIKHVSPACISKGDLKKNKTCKCAIYRQHERRNKNMRHKEAKNKSRRTNKHKKKA